MLTVQNFYEESVQAPQHKYLYCRGKQRFSREANKHMEDDIHVVPLTEAEQVVAIDPVPEQTEIAQIEGKNGLIKVFTNREVRKTDEDIHSLLARVLLMKQKRLQEEAVG